MYFCNLQYIYIKQLLFKDGEHWLFYITNLVPEPGKVIRNVMSTKSVNYQREHEAPESATRIQDVLKHPLH